MRWGETQVAFQAGSGANLTGSCITEALALATSTAFLAQSLMALAFSFWVLAKPQPPSHSTRTPTPELSERLYSDTAPFFV